MSAKRLRKRLVSNFEWPLMMLTVILCIVGLMILYSAGYNHESGYSPQMKRQAISMGIGFIAFFACMLISPTFWKRWAYLFYGICILLLVAILVKGIVAGGARRWLDLGVIRLQPSELMKVGVILALARIFGSEEVPEGGHSLLNLIVPAIVLLIPIGLIAVEPDLGTALSVGLIGGSMILLVGIKFKILKRFLLFCVVGAYPTWLMMKDYQKQRIHTFIQPESDPLGSGYHAIQSLIAVGSGTLFGKGFLRGTQTQLSFLPEQTTDFIFSVLAEEFGFIGSFCVLLLYLVLLLRLVKIASRSSDQYGSFVVLGVAALIFWHVIINVGMVIGILPVVGLTLPLLSYGGSSVVTVMAALGLAAGISMRRFLFV